MSLYEVHEAASLIQEEAHEDANIIFGAVIDEDLQDEIRVTVIATGFGEQRREPERRTFRHSSSDFSSAGPVRDIPRQQVEKPPMIVPTGGAFLAPPVEQQPALNVSEVPPSPLVETQLRQDSSVFEAPPAPPGLHNGVPNGKPVRRLGLVDEKVLDISFAKQHKTKQSDMATETGRNGPKKVGDVDSEQGGRGPHQFANVDIHRGLEIPDPASTPDFPERAMDTLSTVSSGQMGLEEASAGRQLTNLESRVAGFLNQIWRPTKSGR
jgi:hypothetical protein